MYSIFSKRLLSGGAEYSVLEPRVSLFGCNKGRLPLTLKERIAGQQRPLAWHLSGEEVAGDAGSVIIINLKPNKAGEERLHLYELLDAWGYSWEDWTPVMMRMRELPVRDDEHRTDEKFVVKLPYPPVDIYTFLYLQGGVLDGRLNGKWTTPGRSATNSVLLWPPALSYFLGRIAETTPSLMSPR